MEKPKHVISSFIRSSSNRHLISMTPLSNAGDKKAALNLDRLGLLLIAKSPLELIATPGVEIDSSKRIKSALSS